MDLARRGFAAGLDGLAAVHPQGNGRQSTPDLGNPGFVTSETTVEGGINDPIIQMVSVLRQYLAGTVDHTDRRQ